MPAPETESPALSPMARDALILAGNYLFRSCGPAWRATLQQELEALSPNEELSFSEGPVLSYTAVQAALSSLNEKESIRKAKGVYYTPADVVEFMLSCCVRLSGGDLSPQSLSTSGLDNASLSQFCTGQTVFDPTCGAGEFLLAALELKLDLLARSAPVAPALVHLAAGTIYGNDANPDSILITRLRLFLCVFHRFGPQAAAGLLQATEGCFTCRDYVSQAPDGERAFHLILGNPPYVEDAKSGLTPPVQYGNIYANVLVHAARQLAPGGVMGFVIPLSYISTPRMAPLRADLKALLPQQYILSYSDRPDCLFPSVHQKLCLLFGTHRPGPSKVYTGNYRHWYKEERPGLFPSAQVVENPLSQPGYIPKLGTEEDLAIFRKVSGAGGPLLDLLKGGQAPLWLGMRATFWIKAFQHAQTSAEYQTFFCRDAGYAQCLLSSSLFWWYWICISDCWHITRKELLGFTVPCPSPRILQTAGELAGALERRLEETKQYVGTRQTLYEYKHRDCIPEIHRIDDFVNELYGLTGEESRYIKDFSFRYRISGGAADGRN